MKKMLIGGLVVFLMTGLFVGCPNDDKNNGETGETGEDKIAVEYQGKFSYTAPTRTIFYITLTKDKVVFSKKNTSEPEITGHTFSAWTEGDELWAIVTNIYAVPPDASKSGSYWSEIYGTYKLGDFTGNDSITLNIVGSPSNALSATYNRLVE